MDPASANAPLIVWSTASLWGFSVGLFTWFLASKLSEYKPGGKEHTVQLPLLFKLFLPFARHMRGWVERPEFVGARAGAGAKLIQAGLAQALSAEEFVALRLLYALVFLPIGFALLSLKINVLMALGLIFVVFGLLYPSFWLGSQVRLRHRLIQRALPNVLDLLTLSVEAGRDFLTALREILQHREHDPLSDELEQVFREVQLGKQRRHALRAMSDRVKQPDLASVVETLVQADELGVSIGYILRILGDQMRQKRFQRAEKLANESPVKLLFPLFIFIFPAVIIVMLGPILLRSMGNLLQ